MEKWIKFTQEGTSDSGKTKIWSVWGIEGGIYLGEIRWFPSWRKYAFFPAGNTLYEQDCLRDLANFLDVQKEARKR